MNTRLGLIGVLLVLAGASLFVWAWTARSGSAPSTESAMPTPGGTDPVAQAPAEALRAPAPDEPQASVPEPEPEPVLAELAAELPAAEPGAKPLLQQTESDWLLEFSEASGKDLERERDALAERFAEESRVALKLALAEGRAEVVPADAPPVSAPDDPNGLISSQSDAGDGKVQRIVLYPHDAPELYALRSKLQWLERHIASQGGG